MSLDLMQVAYRLKLLLPDGRELFLDELISEIHLEENETEMAARLKASLKNSKLSEGWLHQAVYLAKRLVLFANDGNGWTEVFRGTICKWTYEGKDTTIHVTAYDSLYQLQKSKTHYYCPKGESAAATMKNIAGKWPGITLGQINGPSLELTQKAYTNGSIADIFAERLEEARKKGAGRYVIRDEKGKLCCVKEGSNSKIYLLTGSLLETCTDERSIEDLVTRVQIYGSEGKNNAAPIIATQDGRTEFGIIQEVVYSSSYDSVTKAKQAAAEILKDKGKPEVSRTLVAADIPWIHKGDRIHVSAGSVGKLVNGRYEPVACIVKSVSRDLKARKMTLTLRGE